MPISQIIRNIITKHGISLHTSTMAATTQRDHRIRTILSNKPLGRWSLEHNDKANMRADRANVDHCGTCNNDMF